MQKAKSEEFGLHIIWVKKSCNYISTLYPFVLRRRWFFQAILSTYSQAFAHLSHVVHGDGIAAEADQRHPSGEQPIHRLEGWSVGKKQVEAKDHHRVVKGHPGQRTHEEGKNWQK